MRFAICDFRFAIDQGLGAIPASRLQIANRKSQTRAGFTLIEVLIAMGIFLIGVICVAALFPASVAVQRDTMGSVMGQQVSRRAVKQMQIIAASGVEKSDPLTYHHDSRSGNRTGTLEPFTEPSKLHTNSYLNGTLKIGSRVQPLIDYRTTPNPHALAAIPAIGSGEDGYVPLAPSSASGPADNASFRWIFGADFCSYPSTNVYAAPIAGNAYTTVPDRDYYWFPFIQVSGLDSGGSVNWQGFVVVMHRQPQMNVPQVRWVNITSYSGARMVFDNTFDNDKDSDGIPDLIRPGDFILADNGVVHRVILAEADGCTVDSPVLDANNLALNRIYFTVDVDNEGRVKRESPRTVAWIDGPFPLPVQDPGP